LTINKKVEDRKMAVGLVEKIKDIASELNAIRRRNRLINLELIFSVLAVLAIVLNILIKNNVLEWTSVMSGAWGIAVTFLGIASFFNVEGYYAAHVINGIALTVAGIILALKEFYLIKGDWITIVYVSIIIVGIVLSAIVSMAMSRRR
jgi:hypothetical protein